jgi:hypothetical protein
VLRVSIHAGTLANRSAANQLAVLDIAYDKKDLLSDYAVVLSLRGSGEVAPAFVRGYARWSASIWDLIARSLGQALYRDEQVPASAKPDRRCAYATRICATVERLTAVDNGLELGAVEIAQRGGKRGLYTASFDEDIMGERTVEFEYGCKNLNHAELLMRAICWAYSDTDVPGKKPKLIVPPFLNVDGIDRFHIAALDEPAFTGFLRFRADSGVAVEAGFENMPRDVEYITFLMKG